MLWMYPLATKSIAVQRIHSGCSNLDAVSLVYYTYVYDVVASQSQ